MPYTKHKGFLEHTFYPVENSSNGGNSSMLILATLGLVFNSTNLPTFIIIINYQENLDN
mgnify:CR=1 FL=1